MADVRGTQFADTARDKLVTLMDTLVTEAASDDPKLSNSYDRHTIAKLELNAVTVDLASAETEFPGVTDGPRPEWQLTFSFRVHTGYEGDSIDGRTTTRLMEGVANQLNENQNLGDNYRMARVTGMENHLTFTESASVGGEVLALITIDTCYTQD